MTSTENKPKSGQGLWTWMKLMQKANYPLVGACTWQGENPYPELWPLETCDVVNIHLQFSE